MLRAAPGQQLTVCCMLLACHCMLFAELHIMKRPLCVLSPHTTAGTDMLLRVRPDLLPALVELQHPLSGLLNNILQKHQYQVCDAQVCMHSPLNSLLRRAGSRSSIHGLSGMTHSRPCCRVGSMGSAGSAHQDFASSAASCGAGSRGLLGQGEHVAAP